MIHNVIKVNSPSELFSKVPLKTSPTFWNTPLVAGCHQLDVGRPIEVHFEKGFCHRKYAQIDSELYSIQIRARGLLEILHIRVFSVLIVTQMALCFCFQFALDWKWPNRAIGMFYSRVFELFRCFIIGYANTRSNFRREIECFIIGFSMNFS